LQDQLTLRPLAPIDSAFDQRKAYAKLVDRLEVRDWPAAATRLSAQYAIADAGQFASV